MTDRQLKHIVVWAIMAPRIAALIILYVGYAA